MAQRSLSSKKRYRQEIKRNKRNNARKNAFKDVKRAIKRSIAPASAANKGRKPVGAEKLAELMKTFQQAVDKAAKNGVIHKNKAAREKSRISGLLKRTSKGEALTPRAKSSKKTGKAKALKAGKKKASSRKKK